MSISWQIRAERAEAEVERLKAMLDRRDTALQVVRKRATPWTLSKRSREALREAFNRMKTRKASYLDGLRSGLDWPEEWNHVPGGPYVYSGRHKAQREPGWEAYAARSQQNNDLWRKGWSDGRRIKKVLSAD